MADGVALQPPVVLPEVYTSEFAKNLAQRLEAATRGGIHVKHVLAADGAVQLFEAATKLLATEPTLIEAITCHNVIGCRWTAPCVCTRRPSCCVYES